ncbi:MAG: IS66 family transposase [Planctomycetia bacterium]|nr:IS66 family transposase [Planctomycetia bacterium]
MLRSDPVPRPHEYEQVVEERATRNRVEYLSAKTSGKPYAVVVGDLAAECDAVEGSSRNKREPHLVIGTQTPTSSDKLHLAFAGYAIGEQGRSRPSSGVIVPFGETPKRVKLEPLYPMVAKAVTQLRVLASSLHADPPPQNIGTHCQTCEFHDHCLKEAERTDSLFLLDRMTPKVAAKYQKKGIFTVTQLSYVYRPRRRKKAAGKVPAPFNVELQALAIRTKKIYLHERPSLSQYSVELFLDIEGIPDQDCNYLIGMMAKKGETTTMHSFWADNIERESGIFKECLALVAKYPDAPIYHYGSYERRVIERVAEKHSLDCKALLARLVNVNGMVYGKVYFPARSNRLKDLGAAVGASWPTPNPSGIESIAWRYRWEDSGKDEFKAKLLAYNQADCNALRLLTAEIQSLSKAADLRVDVDFTNKPKQFSTPTGEVVHRAFGGIIDSAHLDYQQKRIRLRTHDKGADPAASPAIRNRPPLPSQKRFSSLAPTIIHVRRKIMCPRHPKQALQATTATSQHIQTDLAFGKNGVRKRLLKYIGHRASCPICGRQYPPPAIYKLQGRMFGHRFLSWVAYQRVVLMLPVGAIRQTLATLFSESVGKSTVCKFIHQLSDDYSYTEALLRRSILQSPFIHVDETKISIQGRNWYVWVLTDGKHVVFRLTDSRETTLIHKLLAGYEGVLVSDFYGGYDSFTCRQQKCLVHLIRNLNDDLWKHPFLTEYECFVTRVRDLLVPIFEDVEKYGSKKRHLQKHMKSVNRFYRQSIDHVTWQSEIVQTYQKRFLRYRESLFLFLTEDGLPWNNNAAERAIRHWAVQRKISGSFFVKGATDYLTLLGIAQSCRFQDKSFLRFLLSEDRDVDAFRERKRKRYTS